MLTEVSPRLSGFKLFRDSFLTAQYQLLFEHLIKITTMNNDFSRLQAKLFSFPFLDIDSSVIYCFVATHLGRE